MKTVLLWIFAFNVFISSATGDLFLVAAIDAVPRRSKESNNVWHNLQFE